MGGLLKNGQWIREQEWETSKDGSFERQKTTFRHRVSRDEAARFRVEPERYHLLVSYACPWAHRTLIIRALKGLEDAVTISVVDPLMDDDGWAFRDERGNLCQEPVTGARYLRDVYTKADAQYTGRVTVPVLWDRRERTIVNNESREVLRMLDVDFEPLAQRSVSLHPPELAARIDETIDAIYEPINNGVYRCGFAGSQSAYERAFEQLFEALDHYDTVLSKQRYLCGSQLTEADICMFTTLLRFDPVYYVHFKCNRRRIIDYEHLSGYLKELYQLPFVAEVCRLDHIKQHYYRSHRQLNPKGIVPSGPDLAWLGMPHGRDGLEGGPPEELRSARRAR